MGESLGVTAEHDVHVAQIAIDPDPLGRNHQEVSRRGALFLGAVLGIGADVDDLSTAAVFVLDILSIRDKPAETLCGARIGLTGFLAGVARQAASANVTINFLLPGLFATRRLPGVHAFAAKTQQISEEEAAERALTRIPARRFGDPAEFGDTCAFLCSAQAGFITGQSLLIDGGAYPGVL